MTSRVDELVVVKRPCSCAFLELAWEAFVAALGKVAFPSMSIFGKKPTISAVVLLEPSTGRWLYSALANIYFDPHSYALESTFP